MLKIGLFGGIIKIVHDTLQFLCPEFDRRFKTEMFKHVKPDKQFLIAVSNP